MSVTKLQASRCQTHHVCQCGAWRRKQLETALQVIQIWATTGATTGAHYVMLRMLEDIASKAKEALETKP